MHAVKVFPSLCHSPADVGDLFVANLSVCYWARKDLGSSSGASVKIFDAG